MFQTENLQVLCATEQNLVTRKPSVQNYIWDKLLMYVLVPSSQNLNKLRLLIDKYHLLTCHFHSFMNHGHMCATHRPNVNIWFIKMIYQYLCSQ